MKKTKIRIFYESRVFNQLPRRPHKWQYLIKPQHLLHYIEILKPKHFEVLYFNYDEN